jgi:hypothetical protein
LLTRELRYFQHRVIKFVGSSSPFDLSLTHSTSVLTKSPSQSTCAVAPTLSSTFDSFRAFPLTILNKFANSIGVMGVTEAALPLVSQFAQNERSSTKVRLLLRVGLSCPRWSSWRDIDSSNSSSLVQIIVSDGTAFGATRKRKSSCFGFTASKPNKASVVSAGSTSSRLTTAARSSRVSLIVLLSCTVDTLLEVFVANSDGMISSEVVFQSTFMYVDLPRSAGGYFWSVLYLCHFPNALLAFSFHSRRPRKAPLLGQSQPKQVHPMHPRQLSQAIIRAWLAVQVELHGQYSINRLRSFYTFAAVPRRWWLTVLFVITPIPCLLLNTVMDFVHLEDPSKGRAANHLFWMRFFVILTLLTYGVLMQFIHLIPRLGVTRQHIALFSVVAASACTGFNYTMAGVIAFPVPFMLLVGTPTWFICSATMFLYFYGRRLRGDKALMQAFARTMAILLCQIGLTLIYPVYILGLVSIPSQYYTAYVVLLPVIKITAKNVISAFVGDNHDMKPEVVIFNVEIFNALYVSLAMQNSTNVSTTLILFAVDFAQAWASMADVYREHRHLKRLMSKIPVDHPLHGQNFLEVARRLVEEDVGLTDERIHAALSVRSDSRSKSWASSIGIWKKQNVITLENESRRDKLASPGTVLIGHARTEKSKSWTRKPTTAVRVMPTSQEPSVSHPFGAQHPSISIKSVVPLATISNSGLDSQQLLRVFSPRERVEFLQRSTRLLFIVEFVILVEYTEVVVPVLYSERMLCVCARCFPADISLCVRKQQVSTCRPCITCPIEPTTRPSATSTAANCSGW